MSFSSRFARRTRRALSLSLTATAVTVATLACTETDPVPDPSAPITFDGETSSALELNGQTRVSWATVTERLATLRIGSVYQLCRIAPPVRDTAATADCAFVVDNGVLDTDPRLGRVAVDRVAPGAYRLVVAGVPTGQVVDTHIERFNVVSGERRVSLESPFVTTPTRDIGTIHWRLTADGLADDDIERAIAASMFEVCRLESFGGRTQRGWCVQMSDQTRIDRDREPGLLELTSLPLGAYAVTQISAPEGVEFDDATQVVELTPRLRDVELPEPFVLSAIETRVSWTSVDGANGEAIPGGTFRLCQTDAWVRGDLVALERPACQAVSDNDTRDRDRRGGRLTVGNLELGRWILTETLAPPGYERSSLRQIFVLRPSSPSIAIERPFAHTQASSRPGCSLDSWLEELERWDDVDDVVSQLSGIHATQRVGSLVRVDESVTGIADTTTLLDLLRSRESTLEVEVLRMTVLTLLDIGARLDKAEAYETALALRGAVVEFWQQLEEGREREPALLEALEDLRELSESICRPR